MKAEAKIWLAEHYPDDRNNIIRASKYYEEKDIWFFTFPVSYFDSDMQGDLCILCQKRNQSEDFHFLKVPFSFLRENRNRFDLRSRGDKFDLHISGKQRNWLVDERSRTVSFAKFEQ